MDGFKQRIIGALVLISLAVIFVPMLLDEPHEERATRSIAIPQEPDFPEVRIESVPRPEQESAIAPVAEPANPPMEIGSAQPSSGDTRSTMNAEESVSPAATESEPAVPAEPEQPRQPEPQAEPEAKPAKEPAESPAPAAQASGGFLVQLGSFGSDSNAQRLLDAVEAAGFTARSSAVESAGQTLTRVFAGPFADKAGAEAAKAKLDEQFGLNTLVIVNDR